MGKKKSLKQQKTPGRSMMLVQSKPPKSRKICQINKQSRDYIYIVYESHVETRWYKQDYAGFFKSKEDAEHVAKCLNNIFTNITDSVYKLAVPYKVEKLTPTLYSVIGRYTNKDNSKLYTDEIISIQEAHSRHKEVNDKVHIMKYYLNDIMPTMNLADYDIDRHKENMKLITNELQKYPQRKKMKDVLENIELLKHAPPSKVLPRGGIGYREMINNSDFKKRWAPWDSTFKD